MSGTNAFRLPEIFPEAKYQRCTLHFYWNLFSVVPRKQIRSIAHVKSDSCSRMLGIS
nr:transposase [Eubacterium limosum]